MRDKKRYEKYGVDNAGVQWEREFPMDRWSFVGVADSDLGLQV